MQCVCMRAVSANATSVVLAATAVEGVAIHRETNSTPRRRLCRVVMWSTLPNKKSRHGETMSVPQLGDGKSPPSRPAQPPTVTPSLVKPLSTDTTSPATTSSVATGIATGTGAIHPYEEAAAVRSDCPWRQPRFDPVKIRDPYLRHQGLHRNNFFLFSQVYKPIAAHKLQHQTPEDVERAVFFDFQYVTKKR